MTIYESVSVILSCLAALISLVVWDGQRKLQRESLEMQKATAELAKKQLELLVREDEAKNTTTLSAELVKEGRDHYFIIRNIGEVEATDVDFEVLVESANNPLVMNNAKQLLPIPKLQPGSKVSLLAFLSLKYPRSYNVKITWTNPNGEKIVTETYVSL
ncbi:TPA: hypothetical protein ACMDOB_003304 [Vibrio metschnikovii]|uniref:hypothetical protein n=1 Tax=Vibrio TaxID=662 RepID=UPI0028DA80C4|nr:hypothetical protein [Vibrio cholerae]EKO3583968.1 hypothetical protein [Vibrio metschnikovii]EJX1709368.1 hypothetical protein [Vibrio cholerae]EKO3608751.1 hypothetical protein [Vibrio metschnikovii]EKO3612272.1 hypothetical protein [Vibrio metschnikovii]